MTSPHRVEVFEGGHTWLPIETATNGIEWMEIQTMKKGIRPRDESLIDELFSKRVARANAQLSGLARMRELKQIAADFEVSGTLQRSSSPPWRWKGSRTSPPP